MSQDPISADPAVSIMTMDILNQVLSRSDNPKELGRYLSEEIRELTGARCVLLVRGPDAPDISGRRILTVHPERRRLWAESPEIFPFFESHLGDTRPSVWHSGEGSDLPSLLRKEGFDISIAIPLMTGNVHVGALFALGLPDIIHLDSVITLLDTLSTIVALVLRNASLYELQEHIIEERTSEVQAAYEEIRSELEERKKIETILQSTNAHLENLITYANVPIIVWDASLTIIRINQAFEHLVGKKADVLFNKSLASLFPADQVEHAMRLIETTQAGVRLNTVEIPIQHEDGSIRTVLWNSSTIFGPDGSTPVATIAQGLDITIRKKLEHENEISLAQIQKNLAQLSILNDGIRNPLTLLLMCAEMTEDSSIITLIEEQTKRIDEMVSQLDKRWIESEKVLNMIRKNYHIYTAPDQNEIWTGEEKERESTDPYYVDSLQSGDSGPLQQEIEAELYVILDSIDAIIYVADLNTHELLYLNKPGRSIFGDYAGKMCYQVIEKDMSGPCPHCMSHLPGDIPVPGPVYNRMTQNSWNNRWYDCRDRIIRWGDGRYVHLQVATDITERKKFEDSLLENEYTFRKLFEDSSDPILLMQDDRFIACNQATLDLLLIPEKEKFIGLTPIDISPDVQPDGRQSLTAAQDYLARAHREGNCRFEWLCSRSDGKPVLLEVSLLPILFKGEEMLHVTWRDVTARKQMEITLTEVNDALTRQTRTLSILNQIISSANEAKTRDQLLEEILDNAIKLLDYDAGGVYFVNQDKEEANVVFSRNLPPDFFAEIQTVRITKPPYDSLFILGIPLVTDHYEQVSPERAAKSGFRSVVSIPFTSKNRIFGALNLISKRRYIVSDDEKQTLFSIGREMGTILERICAEEEAKTQAANVSTIIHSINEMVFVLDKAGKILKINESVTRNLGYSSEELINQDILSLHHPDQREEAARIIQSILAGNRDNCRLPVMTKAGFLIDVETRISRGNWDGKEVLIGVSRDISDQRKVELAVMENEVRLCQALEGAGEGIWDWNLETDEVYYSPGWASILGYAAEEIDPHLQTWERLIHPEDRERVMNEVNTYLSGDVNRFETEFRMIHKDGHVVSILSRGCLYKDYPVNKAKCLIGTNVDITHRKEAELTLQKSEERFRLLLQHVPSLAIQGYLMDGTVRYWNEASERMYGYTAEEAIGKNLLDLIIPSEMKEEVLISMNTMAEAGVGIPSAEQYLMRKDGSRILVYTHHTIVSMPGHPDELFCIDVDMTERKRVEDALLKAKNQINLMTSITRHDIKNKISAILVFLDIALEKAIVPDQKQYLRQVEGITLDIQSLIDFTRIYEDLGSDKPIWQEIGSVLPRSIPKDISLAKMVKGIEVFADPMLEKVFYNLLDNSLRHGETVTSVRIYGKQSGEDLTIYWEDDGTGIPEDQKEQVFERGFGKNTGLGLFLVREILSLTGITITETGIRGKGARFEILIPNGVYRISDQNVTGL